MLALKEQFENVMNGIIGSWEAFGPYASQLERLKEIGRSLGYSDNETIKKLKQEFLDTYSCLDETFDVLADVDGFRPPHHHR